jgi:hypothetical protein
VKAADIGPRAAATSRLVFGLADRGSLFGFSRDQHGRWRRHWRIDGPRLSYPAADGAGFADSIGARAPEFAYVWGAGGNLVRVNTHGGRHWWMADFPDGVHSVSWSHGQLRARALGDQLPDGRFTTYLYVSLNNGRTWTLRRRLGTVPY